MAEIESGVSLFPNGVPWLYAVFAMLFVFFLFVMFSPFLLEIDQHIKKCKYHDLRRNFSERMCGWTWGAPVKLWVTRVTISFLGSKLTQPMAHRP